MTKNTQHANAKTQEDRSLTEKELGSVSGGAKPWEREPTPGAFDTATFTVITRRVK